MTDDIVIHTDGGARGNPGPAAIGVVVEQHGKIIHEISKYIGETTNNHAEYAAVIEALLWLKETGDTQKQKILFFIDSQLIVSQLNGLFKIKMPHLRELVLKIKTLEQEVGGEITYHVIPRTKNVRADLLVNQALDSLNN